MTPGSENSGENSGDDMVSNPQVPNRSKRAKRPKHRLPFPVSVALTLATLFLIGKFLLLPKLKANSGHFDALAHVNPWYLILGMALEVGALIAYALLTRTVLPNNRLSFSKIFRIDLSTLSISHIVPGGTAAGTALGFRLLSASGCSSADATFALSIQGVGSALVLNALLWLGLIASIPLKGLNPLYASAAVIGVLLLGAFGGVVFLLTEGRQRAVGIVKRTAGHLPFVDGDRVERAFRQLAERLVEMGKDRRLLFRAVFWAAANWALDAASLWVFLLSFGHTTLPPYLLVAYGLAYVLAFIPITPGGLGIVETALVYVLVGFGSPHADTLLAVLSYRTVNFLLPIPIGAIAYLSLKFDSAVSDSRNKASLKDLASTARRDAEPISVWAEKFGFWRKRSNDSEAEGSDNKEPPPG